MNLQNRNRVTDIENKLMIIKRGKGVAERFKEFGMSRYKLYKIGETTRSYCVVQGSIFNIP